MHDYMGNAYMQLIVYGGLNNRLAQTKLSGQMAMEEKRLGPDLTKSQQSEEKPEPPKRQKQTNNRMRVADESQSDGLGMLVAVAELDDEAEISSTTSSDADGDKEPQELYDSGSGRD
ncbi:hypothetical protein WJX77_003642 [Trebouxia sp. C0004]